MSFESTLNAIAGTLLEKKGKNFFINFVSYSSFLDSAKTLEDVQALVEDENFLFEEDSNMDELEVDEETEEYEATLVDGVLSKKIRGEA